MTSISSIALSGMNAAQATLNSAALANLAVFKTGDKMAGALLDRTA
jgi:hypothetical protein